MGLMDLMREDAAFIAGDGDGWGVTMVLENADASQTKTVNGIFGRHHIGVNREGMAFNNRTAHVTVSRDALDAVEYIYLDDNEEVDLQGHKVTVDGVKYVVNEWFPGDSFKVITIILGAYAD